MFSWLARLAAMCWRPVRRYARMSKDDDDGRDDPLLWDREIERHSLGEFSIAVVQANEILEDHSQVETGPHSTFVGVYDGHGGTEASRFVRDHLFLHFMRLVRENGAMSEDVLRNAFSATEEEFLALVRRTWQFKPLIAAIGSCCLVGVIWQGTLYIANLGDSRTVVGCLGRSNNIVAEQLTRDHNASMEEVRQELRSLHPDDSQIVVLKHGVWRVKGIIQGAFVDDRQIKILDDILVVNDCVNARLKVKKRSVLCKLDSEKAYDHVSRSIGDAYLKKPEFTIDPSIPKFHLSEPLRRPVLTAEPSIYTRAIRPQDKFLIFASDGLWEHMTNQEAAEIVYNYPRAGIARRLVRTALNEAARKREMRYDDLKKVGKGIRRFFHDDITVVVIFIDHELLGKSTSVPALSVRGFIDTVGQSDFSNLEGIDVNASSAI